MDSIHRRLAAVLSCSALLLSAVTFTKTPAVANGVAPPGCDPTFSGGAGTSTDPYLISSAAHLDDLNGDSDCWDGEFRQTANINMGGAAWTTTTGTTTTSFSGTYDGGGFTISNLDIVLSDDYVGLFGYVTGSIRNVNLEASLQVVGDDYVGGLIGYLDGGSVSGSSMAANVSGDNYVGGLVGQAGIGSVIEDSQSTGGVEGGSNDDYVGGLIGANYGSVIRSYATGNVLHDGGEAVGGLIGENGGTVAYSYAEGNVGNAVTNGADIGGLIGLQEVGAVVTTSYATGNVTGLNSVGGLVGRTRSGSTVSRSFATGAVTRPGGGSGDKTVGGFVGENDGSISDSYATGNVTGGDAGGFAGENDGSITNSYSTGAVSGVNVGGLIWTGTGSVSNSFWNTITSGQASSDGGTGKTTAEMKTLTTFTIAGWSITESCDATTIWGLCSTRNSGYPYLTFYTGSPSTTTETPQTETLNLDNNSGVTCANSTVTGTRGQWVTMPGLDDCAVTGQADARVLGWATRANFPVDIARRQVDNGWGAYEWINDEGKVFGVFIPAGGATFLSNSNRLYPIIDVPEVETSQEVANVADGTSPG